METIHPVIVHFPIVPLLTAPLSAYWQSHAQMDNDSSTHDGSKREPSHNTDGHSHGRYSH